ncbi:MAG: hypothetical protein ACR2MC_09280 [Actinomycetota bacterium]
MSDSRPSLSAHFLWDGSTRVTVSFLDKGPSKSTIVVSHDRLVGAAQAQVAKARWKERLVELKSYLES